MKYFKFSQISAETGISWAIEQPLSGPSMPYNLLPGLNIVAQIDAPYYLGTANDDAQNNPDNHIFELTLEQFATEINNVIQVEINSRKANIYKEENDLRSFIFSKYHDTASLAGIYKYEQAKSLLTDINSASPDVRAEAAVRGMDLLTLANRIITNHEDFRNKESKISGLRGKMLDRLNNFVFDMSNPIASHTEFYSTEIIGKGIKEVFNFETGQMENKEEDKITHKYSLDLKFRYDNL